MGKISVQGQETTTALPHTKIRVFLPIIRAVWCLMTKHTTSPPHPYLTLSQGTKVQKQTGDPPTLLAGSLAAENNSNNDNNKLVRE